MSTDKQTQQWYNENAQKYTDHVRNENDSIYHAYYEKPAMYALLPDLTNKIVLSLGCGSGEDSNYLKKQGADKSVGIDLSTGLLAHARESYGECEFLEMDMEKLSFDTESFDFAYSSLAIHYIEDWTETFKEVFRVLKPNSYFLFSCNHPANGAMEIIDTENVREFRLDIISNKATKEITVVGDYLNRRKLKDALGKDTVSNWSKPFGEIISEAQSAGFIIDRLVEPRPLEKMKEIKAPHYELLNKIPGFVIFRLLKP